MVDDRGHPIVRAELQKLRRELLALADVTATILYSSPASSRKIVISCPFGVGQ
jgi:hypothetical protein